MKSIKQERKVHPVAKFNQVVAKLFFECSFICPFSALCKPSSNPPPKESAIAIKDVLATTRRSHTATKTAITVITAARARRKVIGCFPPAVIPALSTKRDAAV